MLLLLSTGCSIETAGLALHDAGPLDAQRIDASRLDDAMPDGAGPDAPGTDAGPDSGEPPFDAGTDAGPMCVPTDESCNATDDDCNGEVDETGCPCTRETRGTHVYLFCNSELRNWTSAQDFCRMYGYDLVIIEDASENEFVRMRASGDTWIGLSDDLEGVYVWVDGSALGYENWRDPDAPRGNDAYDCVEIDAADGSWLDVGCGGSRPFVCEVAPDR